MSTLSLVRLQLVLFFRGFLVSELLTNYKLRTNLKHNCGNYDNHIKTQDVTTRLANSHNQRLEYHI